MEGVKAVLQVIYNLVDEMQAKATNLGVIIVGGLVRGDLGGVKLTTLVTQLDNKKASLNPAENLYTAVGGATTIRMFHNIRKRLIRCQLELERPIWPEPSRNRRLLHKGANCCYLFIMSWCVKSDALNA